ncbi:hypothetical protein HYH03_009874 [Edaphochlamys debaryana]|uniref:Uncharacterized protein n=1 Tax=Edaphochlamys debaryana TaxID=47281 RepID=A0A836BWH2_9CHLO|nr:hypothetical protein HYH03_009874 [Edaphochlamys debaryana]|eukprot:KAG2491711.1 hypothetical protein HYH03_009874 [Edaphochlamys debaryana]
MQCTCAKASGIMMRLAVFFSVVIGVCLIIFGCKVQNPPKDFAPVMFVILGTLNLFASLLGFWGSYHKKRVLVGFIACGGFSVVLQIALVLALLFSFDTVAKAVADPATDPNAQRVWKQLSNARWALLAFVLVEIFTLVMAVLLRFVIKEDQPYDAFDERNTEQRSNTLSSLAKDIEKFASKSRSMGEKAYDKVRSKMAAKYGNVNSTDGDWRSKTKISWQNEGRV